jgi:hypothetical protein
MTSECGGRIIYGRGTTNGHGHGFGGASGYGSHDGYGIAHGYSGAYAHGVDIEDTYDKSAVKGDMVYVFDGIVQKKEYDYQFEFWFTREDAEAAMAMKLLGGEQP